jgi:hypothetical protein
MKPATRAGFDRTDTGFGESAFTNSEPEPRTQRNAEAASIKGFAGQVWALHTALLDPVWDLVKTFLPRNFRAKKTSADRWRTEHVALPAAIGAGQVLFQDWSSTAPCNRHPL